MGDWCKHSTLCSSEPDRNKQVAKKEIRRLKCNWVFVCLLCSMIAAGYASPMSTIHQFIVNPTEEELVQTYHHKHIEPGLHQSESMYAWIFTFFFTGFSISGLLAGLLANWIPYWYLFFLTILIHIVAYLLYAMATSGLVMMLARALAGAAMGSGTTLVFAYFGVSFETYIDNLKILEDYEKKQYSRWKGFVFSLYTLGKTAGELIGVGVPIVLAIFKLDHFRAVGWFNVAFGAILGFLELLMFQGELGSQYAAATITNIKSIIHHASDAQVQFQELLWKSFIPMYIILVGSLKGVRHVLVGMIVNPILSDTFGFSEKASSYFFLVLPIGQTIGSAVVIGLLYLKVNRFFLTLSGIMCTILGLLIMSDWQAISYDPCLGYSMYHHPELADIYKTELLEVPPRVNIHSLCLPQEARKSWLTGDFYVQSQFFKMNTVNKNALNCVLSNACNLCNSTEEDTCMHFVLTSDNRMCLNYNHLSNISKLSPTEMVSNASKPLHFCTITHHGSKSSSCFIEQEPFLYQKKDIERLLAEVHKKCLQVMQSGVYEIAAKQCESADTCHWIPYSLITHEHCNDCQPICRSIDHTLNFFQFTGGISLFIATLPIMYTATMMLLSNSVTKNLQGISFGCMIALIGVVQSTTPIWLYGSYEIVQKRTFLPMLILVGLFVPLLIGLLLLYPSIEGSCCGGMKSDKEKGEKDGKDVEMTPLKHSSDSE